MFCLQEEAAKRRAAAAEKEVARVLACPAVVTEAATKAANDAKAAGEPKPRKDHSAVHRCVLDLGGPGTTSELSRASGGQGSYGLRAQAQTVGNQNCHDGHGDR